MDSFKDYINEDADDNIEHVMTLLEYMIILESGENLLNEGRMDSVKSTLSGIAKRLGISGHGNKNLLSVMSSVGKNARSALVYAMQAFAGDEKAKEKLKSLRGSKEVRAELGDLILRLDALTMHFLTGPIHMMDAITGFDLAEKIREAATGETHHIDNAIQTIEKAGSKLQRDKTSKVRKSLNLIKKVFGRTTKR